MGGVQPKHHALQRKVRWPRRNAGKSQCTYGGGVGVWKERPCILEAHEPDCLRCSPSDGRTLSKRACAPSSVRFLYNTEDYETEARWSGHSRASFEPSSAPALHRRPPLPCRFPVSSLRCLVSFRPRPRLTPRTHTEGSGVGRSRGDPWTPRPAEISKGSFEMPRADMLPPPVHVCSAITPGAKGSPAKRSGTVRPAWLALLVSSQDTTDSDPAESCRPFGCLPCRGR